MRKIKAGFVGFGEVDFDQPLSEQDLFGFGLQDLDLLLPQRRDPEHGPHEGPGDLIVRRGGLGHRGILR